jgi:hypothetical protein
MKFTNKRIANIASNALNNWSMSGTYRERTADKILNIKFLDGKQWEYFSLRTQRFAELIPTENVPKVTANMFVPYAESVKSKILSMNPSPVVVSLTRDWSDVTLALNYQKMFQGILENINFKDKMQDLIDVQLVCAGVFLLPFWNKEIDDIDVDVISDIASYSDPLAKDPKKCRYNCFFDILSTEYVNEKYKKKYSPDKLENAMEGWYLSIYKELQGIGENKGKHTIGSSRNVEINDATMIVKVFYKEGKQYKMATVANLFKGDAEVLDIIDLDAELIYIPYYRNFFSKQGRTPLSGLRGVQRDMNQMLTRVKYDFSKREKMLVDENSIDLPSDIDTFDMAGDEVVRFASKIPGQLPVKWDPSHPKTLDFNLWLRMWGEAGGQSDASRGNSPTSQASGALTEMLIDQDETKIGNAKANLKVGLKYLFKEMLKLIHVNYKADRVVAIMGRERGWQSYSYSMFKNEKLNKFDVSVNIGEAMPNTPMARLNMAFKISQFGMYNDMPNPFEKIRDLAGLTAYEFDVIDQHTDKQQYEIEQIIQSTGEGNLPGVSVTDDSLKHIGVLIKFINTRDFDDLNPGKKQLIMAHLGMHQELVSKMVPPSPMQGTVDPEAMQNGAGVNTKTSPPQGQGTVPKAM